MAYSASTPTSTASFGNVSRTGDHREGFAREIEAISSYVAVDYGQKGTIPGSASTRIAPAGSTTTLTLASGCLRTISTVAIATGMTLAIQTTGAVQGQRFRICKIATGGTGAVTIDGNAFTTHKKFNCELMFVNGAWRMVAKHEYA